MGIALSQNEKERIISLFRAESGVFPVSAVKYLDLGVGIIRVLCHTVDVLPVLTRQLGYVLQDSAEQYDSTIVVWKNDCSGDLMRNMYRQLTLHRQMQFRASLMIIRGRYPVIFNVVDESTGKMLGRVDWKKCAVECFDDDNKTAYVSLGSFEPENIVRQGHAFVRVINHLIKSETVNLTHGAVFGYAGNGFLLCGRGKRGKSTLTVESMLQGFDYVSDDYQILKKTPEDLLAYPIYSIVTLGYRVYNEMYDRFLGKFVCNNFTQDKYLFNIASYHGQFRTGYPIRFCLFPEIVPDEHPSLSSCTVQEKGRAVVQMIHSTLKQMDELGEKDTVRKLLDMVWQLPFLKFNLCSCIPENTSYLRTFLESDTMMQPDLSNPPPALLDVTSGLAVILDTQSLCFAEMNRLATDVFTLVLSGTDPALIRTQLEGYTSYNPGILTEFEKLMELFETGKYSALSTERNTEGKINSEAAEECGYKLSVNGYIGNNIINLLK